MKELRQAQDQARNENLARSLGQASSGQVGSGQTRGEDQSLARKLARSSGEAKAKVEKWQIWKGSAEEKT